MHLHGFEILRTIGNECEDEQPEPQMVDYGNHARFEAHTATDQVIYVNT